MARAAPATSTNSAALSSEGALIALSVGVLGGVGVALFNDDNTQRLVKRACGGGLIMLSAYLFAPAGLRKIWLVS